VENVAELLGQDTRDVLIASSERDVEVDLSTRKLG